MMRLRPIINSSSESLTLSSCRPLIDRSSEFNDKKNCIHDSHVDSIELNLICITLRLILCPVIASLGPPAVVPDYFLMEII